MSVQGDRFKEIADAIRAKKGTIDPIKASDFATEIASIEAGGETLGGEYNIEQIVDGDNCELVITTAGQPENKLAQVLNKTITELTAEDLAGATQIGEYAFWDCDDLTSITIPDSVTKIKNQAFYGCDGLTSITIPNSVTSIGQQTFAYSKLTNITLPSSLTFISNGAFNVTGLLKSVHIKDLSSWLNITFADEGSNPCFSGKANLYLNNALLTDILIPNDITTIKAWAFAGVSGLNTVEISNGVTSIEKYAFRNCSASSITISDTVTAISNYAFYNCSGLTSINIPSSLSVINQSTFSGCSGLPSITIPSNITKINSQAFYNCSALTEMTILATTPPTLSSTNAISNATTTIYIPAGTLSAYQTATNWSNFADKFVEMEA